MSYKAGIVKAIADFNDRTGSSMVAIKKHMQNALPGDKKWANTVFLSALKSGVAKGDLVQIKGSYKISPEFKKKLAAAEKKAAAPKKKTAPKKVAPKKKTAPKKKAAPKKKVVKKKKTAPKKATKKSGKVTKKSSKKSSKKTSKQ